MEEINHKMLFESIPLPCLLLKPTTAVSFKVVEANDAYIAATGSNKENLLTCSFPGKDAGILESIVLQESFKRVVNSAEKDTTSSFRYDLRIRDTTVFEERYWRSNNSPLFDSEGKVVLILHVLLDATEEILNKKKREKIEEDLLLKQRQYQHFINENPDGLYSLDLEGNFLSANKGLAELAGVSLEQLLEMNFMPFCDPLDRKKIQQCFEKTKRGESNKFEARFISRRGTPKILEVSLAPVIEGNEITGVYGIAKDITDMRKAESIVVEKRKFLEVNAAFMSSLIENEPEDPALEETFGIIGSTVGVDRMYYFGAKTDTNTKEIYISQILEWCSKFAAPQKDNPEMQNMSTRKIEEIMGPLSNNTPFMAVLSKLPNSDLKDLFLDQDIKSMLLLPIFFQQKLYGFIGFDDCRRERHWKEDEITFLQSLAHFFSNALEKRAAQRAVKQKEEELRRSEQKFKALVQEGSDLIAILDQEGNFTFTSDTSTSALGVSPSEFYGKNAFQFIHPDDLEMVQQEFALLKQKKQVRSAPYRFRNKEGNWRWIETAATNLLDDPAVGGIVINSRDVTTIVEQAREIERINERYVLAAAATQDLIYDWDLEKDEVQRFHRSMDDLLGHPISEVDKKGFWRSHIHPDELEELQNTLKSTLADPKKDSIRTEYRFRRADGTYAQFIDRGHIIRNSEGKAIRLIGASSDISEITAKKEALEAANTRFKLAMKATSEMIWDWDILTDTVNRSKSFGKIYGYGEDTKSSMTNFWLPKITAADRTRVTNSLEYALKNEQKKEWKQEYRFVKADGSLAYVMDRGYIIRDKSGNPTRMVGAVLDVTASRRLIKDIKRQNRGLKEIAWEQSHIVRAPLARLKGLVDLLDMKDLEEKDNPVVLENIRNSANELDNILRSIVNKAEKIEINHETSTRIK